MAKITLENTREHDISLAVVAAGGATQVTIPAARQDAADKNKLVNGSAEADDAFVTAARKSPVVAHYFDEGWLRVAKQPVKPAAKE